MEAPKYGSKDYWNDRYESFESASDSIVGAKDAEKENESDVPEPYHAWYFSYKDLRPLLLPLVIGSDGYADMCDLDEHDDEKDTEGHVAEKTSILEVDGGDDNSAESNDPEDDGETDQAPRKRKRDSDRVEAETESHDVDDEDEIDDASIESSSSSASEGNVPNRIGLAKNSSVSVIEIGCGDVPLGLGIEADIRANLLKTMKTIICTDYSSVCIESLKSQCSTKSGDVLQFQQADARKLPFEDATFHLVVEKGTLDAMLSDKEIGESNCVSIVAECARVLTAPGFIFLVSHLNANTPEGVEWLENIVFKGLRKGDSSAAWRIEVHGNDEADSSDEDASLGPAVYVIEKISTGTGSTKETIPVKLYSY